MSRRPPPASQQTDSQDARHLLPPVHCCHLPYILRMLLLAFAWRACGTPRRVTPVILVIVFVTGWHKNYINIVIHCVLELKQFPAFASCRCSQRWWRRQRHGTHCAARTTTRERAVSHTRPCGQEAASLTLCYGTSSRRTPTAPINNNISPTKNVRRPCGWEVHRVK